MSRNHIRSVQRARGVVRRGRGCSSGATRHQHHHRHQHHQQQQQQQAAAASPITRDHGPPTSKFDKKNRNGLCLVKLAYPFACGEKHQRPFGTGHKPQKNKGQTQHTHTPRCDM